jgi:7TMR-DISM extracellular 2
MTTLPVNRQGFPSIFVGIVGLFVLLHALFSPAVLAQDKSEPTTWISKRAYLDDPSGKYSFADVLAQNFTPYEGFISRGNSNKTLWLKLNVPAHSRADLVLTIEPAYLRTIDVYTQNAQGQWLARPTGSRVAFDQRERSELYFALGLETQPQQASSIYVRLNSPTLMLPNVEIISSRASHNKDNAFHIGISAYILVSLLVVLASLIAWRFSGDSLWLIAAAHDLVSMWVLSNMTGFTAKYFVACHLPIFATRL